MGCLVVSGENRDGEEGQGMSKTMMRAIGTSCRFSRFLLLLSSLSLHFISGFCDDSSSKDATKAENHAKSKSGSASAVFLVLLGVASVVLFSFFLYKLWLKKKRDEQYARLLKLFEEDDELEVELGIRD